MQQLEVFQYAIMLDLKMGYYTITILPASQDMTTAVTEFGKFRDNLLPMGMCTSGGIFQDKVDDMTSDIKGIKTYINSLL